MKNYISFIFFVSFLIIFSACENDVDVVNTISESNKEELPAETSINVEFLYSDSSKVRSKLIAPQVDRYVGKEPYFEMINGMEVIFYDEYPIVQTKLSAKYGIGKDNGNGIETMEAQRDVVVINEKGDKLNTEQLTWNGITQKIYTEKFVKITTKNEIIWGEGLEANEDFSEYEIKNVKGQISINDSI